MNRYTLAILLFSFLSDNVYSQLSNDTLVARAVNRAWNIYTDGIGGEAHLFNGVQYKEMNLHNYDEGFPYYLSDDWLQGSVFYDGQLYKNVFLFYDIVHDKVIVEHTYSHFKLELINEKLKYFTLPQHKFVRLVKDTLAGGTTVRTGFYDLIYDGTVKVYVKRKKEIKENLENRVVKIEFQERNQYYVYKNSIYYPVKSKGSVLKVFADRKTDIRKYLSKNKIHFKPNREGALIQSASFYDQTVQ